MRSRRTAAVVLTAMIFWAGLIPAEGAFEDLPENLDWRLNGRYLGRIPADCWTAWTAPIRWDGNDFLTLAAAAGATGLFLAFDRDLFDWIQDGKTEASMDASPVISKIGNGGYLTAFLAVLYGGGEIFDSRSVRKTALVGFESFLAASAMVTAIKIVVGRARPYAGEGPASYHPFSFKGRYASFVSGDAAGAFAVAATIAANSESFWIDALAYTAAGLAAVYRVHDRKHWPSDAVAGSLVGYFTARALNALNRGGNSLRVSLDAGRDRRSVTLSFFF
ncbi:MAG: phosphatase PAP2 family protein [Candidatus Aminicenantes bacterium]|nr:phosphatase PAP2 family protein [Candidatus Aminicenantes bacterium]